MQQHLWYLLPMCAQLALASTLLLSLMYPVCSHLCCQPALDTFIICHAGDCLVQGFNPPENAVVIQDSVPGDATDQTGGIPLLRPPRGYERVFQDEQSRNDKQLSIWKPVPMPGFVLPAHSACLTNLCCLSCMQIVLCIIVG